MSNVISLAAFKASRTLFPWRMEMVPDIDLMDFVTFIVEQYGCEHDGRFAFDADQRGVVWLRDLHQVVYLKMKLAPLVKSITEI